MASSSWRHWFRALLAAALMAVSAPAETGPSREYQLKAVFVLNFTMFTQWPASAFDRPDAPVIIGVLGDDPFAGALDEAVIGEKVGHRPIVVQRYRRVQEASQCHVLFISASERGDLNRIFAALQARPILTVSDIPDFARRGGAIGFYLEGPRLRFEINPMEAQRNALQLSSQLLNLARIVPEG